MANVRNFRKVFGIVIDNWYEKNKMVKRNINRKIFLYHVIFNNKSVLQTSYPILLLFI